jgi:uroporphyrin-III C-methyltransferase
VAKEKGGGCVYLVGAGPGDPRLLTHRAAELIAAADDLLVDALVPRAIYAGARGRILFAGKRCGRVSAAQGDINETLVRLARAGRQVVRLKCGDPGLLGRAQEEMDALRLASVPVEVVPGVSSVQAAAAALGVSLTAREVADRVVVATGRGSDGRSSLPLFMPGQTLALLMPGIEDLSAHLAAAGYPADLPCAIVSAASQPKQTLWRGRVADIMALRDLPRPALLLAGAALGAAGPDSPAR